MQPVSALPNDLRARVHERRPGDEFTFNGWQRPLVLLAPPARDNRALAKRIIWLLIVAALLTLLLVWTGAR